MKHKKIKGLHINKQTISNLNLFEKRNARGGGLHTEPPWCDTQTNCESRCDCTVTHPDYCDETANTWCTC